MLANGFKSKPWTYYYKDIMKRNTDQKIDLRQWKSPKWIVYNVFGLEALTSAHRSKQLRKPLLQSMVCRTEIRTRELRLDSRKARDLGYTLANYSFPVRCTNFSINVSKKCLICIHRPNHINWYFYDFYYVA